ncbi:MAG: hypothetical protein PVF74_00410 [Anaerolineales bacterium]
MRGWEYFESSNVMGVIWREDQLTARVQGSEWVPYVVRVEFDGQDIGYVDCTCPYDWGGDCKHIVAALLFLVHNPEMIEQRPSIADLLGPLDREQLVDMLRELAEEFPAIIDTLESLVSRATLAKEAPQTSTSQAPVDFNLLRRQIKAELRTSIQTGYDAWGEDRFYDSDLGAALEPALERAQIFLDTGDPLSALAILEASAEAWDEGILSLDEFVQEAFEDVAEEFTYPLAELWAESLLSADLTPDEREYWVDALEEYCETLYGGGSLELALAAARQGWDYPPLVAVLQGDITEHGAWEGELPDYADFLAEIRLRVLERRGQFQEYLYLARAEGQYMPYLHMLVRLGDTEKALQEAMGTLTQPEYILKLARSVAEHGPIEKAFSLAQHGLALESGRGKAELAEWLRDRAQGHQRDELALWAAQRALAEKASLENYKMLQKIAGSEWETLKPEALKTVADDISTGNKVDVYLYEKMYPQAIEAVDSAEWFYEIDKVIEAVKTEHPEWAFRQCSIRADQIMDAGRAKDYAIAADWLQRGRDILVAAGMHARWDDHLSDLMETHQRKYKLMPMLQNLRR